MNRTAQCDDELAHKTDQIKFKKMLSGLGEDSTSTSKSYWMITIQCFRNKQTKYP